MKVKPGVSLKHLKPQMLVALTAAELIWWGRGEELVITSGSDGIHAEHSLHYLGYALDFRTHYFDPQVQEWIRDQLASALGDEYDVVLENTHMHVEYDPKAA